MTANRGDGIRRHSECIEQVQYLRTGRLPCLLAEDAPIPGRQQAALRALACVGARSVAGVPSESQVPLPIRPGETVALPYTTWSAIVVPKHRGISSAFILFAACTVASSTPVVIPALPSQALAFLPRALAQTRGWSRWPPSGVASVVVPGPLVLPVAQCACVCIQYPGREPVPLPLTHHYAALLRLTLTCVNARCNMSRRLELPSHVFHVHFEERLLVGVPRSLLEDQSPAVIPAALTLAARNDIVAWAGEHLQCCDKAHFVAHAMDQFRVKSRGSSKSKQ